MSQADARPNFVLFITDQHRSDHLGAYGNAMVGTPHIDSLAARGWSADRCFVAAPSCMPNRSSLMTGRMPSVHGARHNGIPLSLDERTFVERLSEDGYRTALVGKSHLQNMSRSPRRWPPEAWPATQDEARKSASWDGLDQEADGRVRTPFYGFEDVELSTWHGDVCRGDYRRWLDENYPEVSAASGPDGAIPTPEYELSRCGQAWRSRVPEELTTTSWIAQESISRIQSWAGGSEPFFIQCSFPDPHHPFTPPGRFWDMYDPDDVDLPANFGASSEGVRHLGWLRTETSAGRWSKSTPTFFAATEREAREAIALNYGSISHIDDAVGLVLAALTKAGIADNTVVIFTSDHGDYMGDHGLLLKGPAHYQSVIRVPLIWADPDDGTPRRSGDLCSTIDLAPTILARAGSTPYNGIQGLSLLDAVQGDAAVGRESLIIEDEGQRVQFGFPGRTQLRTLLSGSYRLSVYEAADWGELYDLATDPDEIENLWDEPSAAGLRSALLYELAKTMIRLTDPSPHPIAIA